MSPSLQMEMRIVCLTCPFARTGADSIPVAAVLDRLARCYLVLGDTGKAANVINRSRNILASIKWADATLAEKNLCTLNLPANFMP